MIIGAVNIASLFVKLFSVITKCMIFLVFLNILGTFKFLNAKVFNIFQLNIIYIKTLFNLIYEKLVGFTIFSYKCIVKILEKTFNSK